MTDTKKPGTSWVNISGWAGNQLLAWCALPQVIHTVQTGSAEGLNPWFIGMWGVGEILALIYAIFALNAAKPLLVNYIINLTCIGILIAYM